MTIETTPEDFNMTPNILTNNGGTALPLPAQELPLEPAALDISRWTLVREDRVLFEARAKVSLDARAKQALNAKKGLKEETTKKKSLNTLFSECL